MELAGKVIAILEARTGVAKTTGNPWMIQEYVIETHEQYPRRMSFNVFGEDKIRQFNIQLNEEINVFFDINAREYQGRWFNDIRAWRIDRVTQGEVPAAGSSLPTTPTAAGSADSVSGSPIPSAQPIPSVDFTQEETADDLPF